MAKDNRLKNIEKLFRRKDRKRFRALDEYILWYLGKKKTVLLENFLKDFSKDVRDEIEQELPSTLSSLEAKGYVELFSGLNALYVDSKGRSVTRVSLR